MKPTDACAIVVGDRVCYSACMVTVPQRHTASLLLHSLALGSASRLLLAVVAGALALSLLGLRDAAPHLEPPKASAALVSASIHQHAERFTPAAAPSGHAEPATSSHSHCVSHCLLDSLLLPGLLLSAPLLAARIAYPLTLAPQRLTASPLSPPPQAAH